MKVYIAYKYSNNHDKEKLISSLEKLSLILQSWSINTFILGRDVKKWKHVFLGTIRLLPLIIKNMKKTDLVLAYVDSEKMSKGLFLEAIISKILKKPSVMVLVSNSKSRLSKYFFKKVITITDLHQLKIEDLKINR